MFRRVLADYGPKGLAGFEHRLLADDAGPADFLRPYDEVVYLAEADLLLDWYLPAVTGAASTRSLTWSSSPV